MNPKDHFLFIPNAISLDQEQDFLSKLHDSSNNNVEWTQLKRRRLVLAGACPSSPAGTTNKTDEVLHKPIPSFITGSLLDSVNEKLLLSSKGDTANFVHQPFSSSSDKLNILINEYHSPNGILLHTDGPSYQPRVCIISLESTVPLVFTPNVVPDGAEQQNKNNTTSGQNDGLYDDDDEDDDENDSDDEESNSITSIQSSSKNWMKRAKLISKITSKSDLLTSDENSPENLQDARLQHPDTFCVLLPPRSMIVFSGVLYTHYLHGILENVVDVLPVSKIANFEQIIIDNENDGINNSMMVKTLSVTPPKDRDDSNVFAELKELSKIKEIDRVDLINSTNRRTYEDVVRNCGSSTHYFYLLKQSENDFRKQLLVIVRKKSRTSLTYRNVV